MPSREEVYKAVDSEREYQDSLPPTRTEGHSHSVGAYITMMRHYVAKMDEAWTMNPGDEQALDVMRKVAGIAVHCMEDHGAPHRKGVISKEKDPYEGMDFDTFARSVLGEEEYQKFNEGK